MLDPSVTQVAYERNCDNSQQKGATLSREPSGGGGESSLRRFRRNLHEDVKWVNRRYLLHLSTGWMEPRQIYGWAAPKWEQGNKEE